MHCSMGDLSELIMTRIDSWTCHGKSPVIDTLRGPITSVLYMANDGASAGNNLPPQCGLVRILPLPMTTIIYNSSGDEAV